jgi:hypothetical protein
MHLFDKALDLVLGPKEIPEQAEVPEPPHCSPRPGAPQPRPAPPQPGTVVWPELDNTPEPAEGPAQARVTSLQEPTVGPEPPAGPEALEQPADEPAGPTDLGTQAPVIGRVLPITWRSPRPGHEPRVPDVAADGLVIGPYHLAAASLIGSSHVGNGSTRQDGYAFGLDEGGRLCAVVADGLGSRSHSQLGARLLAEQTIRVADTLAEPAAMLGQASADAAEILARTYGLTGRETGCVGLVAVFDGGRCRLARVGDCTAFVLGEDGFTDVFTEDSGFLNHVSAALLDEEVRDVEVAELEFVTPVLLATDGLATDLRKSPRLRSWLADRWRGPATAFALVDSMRYRRQGSHDDRTAVMIWP